MARTKPPVPAQQPDTRATLGKALQGAAATALQRAAARGELSGHDIVALARTGQDLDAANQNRSPFRLEGRKTALTPEVFDAIVTSLVNGSTLEAAAAAAGIGTATVHEWIARGLGTDERPSTPLYAEFADAVTRAREQAVHVAMNAVFIAGTVGIGGQPPDPKMAVEWLRLAEPRRFTKRIALDVGEVMKRAEEVARELGLEGHAESIRERAEQILAAAGGGR
ncbi:MAG: hypothetical protein WC211_01460 [Dehalococcoidia bacterium]